MGPGRSDVRIGEILRKLGTLGCTYRLNKNHYTIKNDREGRPATFPLRRGNRISWKYVRKLQKQLGYTEEEWDDA